MSERPAPAMRTDTMRITLTLTLLAAVAMPAAAQEHAPDVHARIHPGPLHTVAWGPAAAQRQGQATQTERTTRTLRLGPKGELDVANISGDIVVQEASGNEASIEITKTARGASDAEAQELLRLVQVEITERPSRAEVRVEYPQGERGRRQNRRNFSVDVHYAISVPAGVRVRAKSVSGSISAKGVGGELSAESVSGNVTIERGGRLTSAKSISGTVQITETELDGPFQVSSVSGNVVLRRVKAQGLSVGSISGDVSLEDVTCPRLKAQTVSGDVRFSGPLPRNGRYDLNSHSGSLTVAVAATEGFELEATSFSGSVRSDFPLESGGGDDQGARRRQRAVRGVHGDGSAFLSLTTFSGNIVVTRR